MMFGRRPETAADTVNPAPEEEKTDENQLDYMKIMMQVDDIMGSWNDIKPVFKQLSPMLDLIKKKIGS